MDSRMLLTQKIFAIGEMIAISGVGIPLLLMVFFLFSRSFDAKKHQKFFFIGFNICFLGIFVMAGALMYGILGVTK